MISFSVYDFEESVEFAFEEWNAELNKDSTDLDHLMLTTYKDVDAVVDVPHSYFFDDFHKFYPDAKVRKFVL